MVEDPGGRIQSVGQKKVLAGKKAAGPSWVGPVANWRRGPGGPQGTQYAPGGPGSASLRGWGANGSRQTGAGEGQEEGGGSVLGLFPNKTHKRKSATTPPKKHKKSKVSKKMNPGT